MGNYDRMNEMKAKHQKEVEELNKRIDELLEDKKKLKEELKQLKHERYQDNRGSGEVERLKDELKKANHRIAQLEAREKSKESYTCFDQDKQRLISQIRNLKSNNKNYDNLYYKFKNGAETVLIIAKKAFNDDLTIRDCYIHVFRDDLMSLFEKTLQVIVNKKHLTLFKLLIKLKEKELVLDKEFKEAVPALKDRKIFGYMLSLVYMENTAFHGTSSSKRVLAPNEEDEKDDIDSFRLLDKDNQLLTIFTILELIYYVFTCENKEQNLLMINSQWK